MRRLLPPLLLLAGCAAPRPVDPPRPAPLPPGPAQHDCARTFCGCWQPLTLSIHGTVADAETGAPLAALLASDDGRPLGQADAQGRFQVRLETEWSPGCKLKGTALLLTAPGREVALEPLPAGAGPGRTELELEAALFPQGGGAPAEGTEGVCGWGPRQKGTLELRVVNAQGEPLGGAAALGAHSDATGHLEAVTQVRGSARCGTGPHRVQVKLGGLRGSAPLLWVPDYGGGYLAHARVVLRGP